MKVYKSVSELIGKTPIMELAQIKKLNNLKANLFAKLECFNPAGSAKDRVAKAIIEEAIKSGMLKSGSVIIEPTSGNTGIGIASVAASMGYKVIVVMPETMSIERRQLMSAYGAEVVLTDGKLGMNGAIEKAEQLNREIKDSIIAGQFTNPANPKAHYDTTAPEIYDDMDGKIDIFVSGVGTGGTITGVGKFLKEKNPDVKIVAVEPVGSAVLSGESAGPHKLQGIGAGFVPQVLDTKIYNEIITVTADDAYDTARCIAKTEGVLVGISSGAAAWAAITLANREENKGKNIVVLLPDSGERYLSSSLFD